MQPVHRCACVHEPKHLGVAVLPQLVAALLHGRNVSPRLCVALLRWRALIEGAVCVAVGVVGRSEHACSSLIKAPWSMQSACEACDSTTDLRLAQQLLLTLRHGESVVALHHCLIACSADVVAGVLSILEALLLFKVGFGGAGAWGGGAAATPMRGGSASKAPHSCSLPHLLNRWLVVLQLLYLDLCALCQVVGWRVRSKQSTHSRKQRLLALFTQPIDLASLQHPTTSPFLAQTYPLELGVSILHSMGETTIHLEWQPLCFAGEAVMADGVAKPIISRALSRLDRRGSMVVEYVLAARSLLKLGGPI